MVNDMQKAIYDNMESFDKVTIVKENGISGIVSFSCEVVDVYAIGDNMVIEYILIHKNGRKGNSIEELLINPETKLLISKGLYTYDFTNDFTNLYISKGDSKENKVSMLDYSAWLQVAKEQTNTKDIIYSNF